MGSYLKYYSHPGKALEIHLKNVSQLIKEKNECIEAQIAGLFHDLGKINPNYQTMLNTKKKKGYTNHSYLSAYIWLYFCKKNMDFINYELKLSIKSIWIITLIIAKHHGNLPDLEKGIFLTEPREEFENFLKLNLGLPISEFICSNLNLKINNFLFDFDSDLLKIFPKSINVQNHLDFFFTLQNCFALMLVADKRDANDNPINNRDLVNRFGNKFNENLQISIDKLDKEKKLSKIRNKIRIEALDEIRKHFLVKNENERIFSVTAPTGSGKTLLLLNVAGEILKNKEDLSIIYSLPFLSITEQIEEICNEIWKKDKQSIRRIDSKSVNERVTKLIEKLDNSEININVDEILNKITIEDFSDITFDYPFIITTFVQIFETLVSNKNSTLLKLPNFSKSVIIIDEYQALPPRLYIFFTAFLDAFCKKFDSYVLLSSATLPNFHIPTKKLDPKLHPKKLFPNYFIPIELIKSPEKYFRIDLFNRYQIEFINNQLKIEELAKLITEQNDSCLIILNTIKDTYDLYNLINSDSKYEILLLNTRFTPNDRKTIIDKAKTLKKNKKFILISTQLIEAGVDLDFPIVFRDMCPLPSLIQSAGRCNRNNELDIGIVYFFELIRNNGIIPSKLIYTDFEGDFFLKFCKENISGKISEIDLYDIQKTFFKEKIAQNLTIGKYPLWDSREKKMNKDSNLIQCIVEQKYGTLGTFRLINKEEFGNEIQVFVPTRNSSDKNPYFELKKYVNELHKSTRYSQEWKLAKSKIKNSLKELVNETVTIHVKDYQFIFNFISKEEICGIHILKNQDFYSEKLGLNFDEIGNNSPI